MIETICSQSEDFDFMLLQVPQLRKEFSGKVIAPGDPEYDQARSVFFGHYRPPTSNHYSSCKYS